MVDVQSSNFRITTVIISGIPGFLFLRYHKTPKNADTPKITVIILKFD